jgi:hypothetical protein
LPIYFAKSYFPCAPSPQRSEEVAVNKLFPVMFLATIWQEYPLFAIRVMLQIFLFAQCSNNNMNI